MSTNQGTDPPPRRSGSSNQGRTRLIVASIVGLGAVVGIAILLSGSPQHVAERPPGVATRPESSTAPPRSRSTTDYCASAVRAWAGTGKTIAVSPGQSLQAAADAAANGDTIELADGTYSRASVTLNKAVRIRARNRLRAVLVGNAKPRYANDTTVGTPTDTAVAVRASGAMVEGLDIRLYETAVDVEGVANTVVQRNRITSGYDVGVALWDTRNAEVRCNEILDPYLADDPVASLTAGAISDAQMDYGVAAYGSQEPRVHHNYFHGVFNQALSFKEGNRDPYAGYNTFEGFNLTALFFGQNTPNNGPYHFTGLPVGPDHGTLVAEYNVFRNVYGLRGRAKVVYFARSPVRVWHVKGDTTLRGNVVESSRQGFALECRAGADDACATGTILVQHNTIGGKVKNLSGTATKVNTTSGVIVYTGLRARVRIDSNEFVSLPAQVKSFTDGVTGAPLPTQTNGRALSSSSSDLVLRQASPATDPDLSYADASRTQQRTR